MQYGEKIAKLRRENGMTQADLGKALNVTFQAVSKWERDESFPDFETMSKMAKLFDVPISYFEDGVKNANQTSDSKPEQQQPQTTAQQQKHMIGFCKECGKIVYEGDAASTSPIICKSCADKKEDEEKQRENARLKDAHGTRNCGLIWSAFLTAAALAIAIITLVSSSAQVWMYFVGIAATLVFGYTFFAQLFWCGVITDIIMFGGKTIGTPGVIFDLDLDGFFLLIAFKILFAIIRLLIWLLTFMLSALVAIAISPFVFPFALAKLNRGQDLD